MHLGIITNVWATVSPGASLQPCLISSDFPWFLKLFLTEAIFFPISSSATISPLTVRILDQENKIFRHEVSQLSNHLPTNSHAFTVTSCLHRWSTGLCPRGPVSIFSGMSKFSAQFSRLCGPPSTLPSMSTCYTWAQSIWWSASLHHQRGGCEADFRPLFCPVHLESLSSPYKGEYEDKLFCKERSEQWEGTIT